MKITYRNSRLRFFFVTNIIFITFLMIFFHLGCSKNKKVPLLQNSIKMGNVDSLNIEIGINSFIVIEDKGLEIQFASLIEDSRCPIGARCIWEGNAKINLLVKTKSNTNLVELNINLDPRKISNEGFSLKLISLEPHPKLGVDIDSTSYKASILFSRKK